MTDRPTDVATILKRQYHAGLRMLRQAIASCPAALWTGIDTHPNAFWHVAYHVLFYVHLYAQRDVDSFVPWAQHRREVPFFGRVPWPPHDPPDLGTPYTQAEVLAYWAHVDGLIDATVDGLDLASSESGFPWYPVSKLEHQLISLRHLQHHAAQLADRVRRVADVGTDWVATADAAA